MTDRADDPRPDLHVPQRDIDFASFFAAVWGLRVPLAVAMALVSVAYWGWALLRGEAADPWSPAYSRNIHFVFDGAEQGRYPNGAPFHLADMLAPKLLAELYDSYGLAERGVHAPSFFANFNVEPHVPEYDAILERYTTRMMEADEATERDDRAALATALTVLHQQLETDLLIASRRAATLSFLRLPGTDALQMEEIDKLLLDLPERWATRAINEYGVLRPDVAVPNPAAFADAEFTALDYLPALDKLRQRVRALRGGLAALLAIAHAGLVRDDETGLGLRDAETAVAQIETFDVVPLAADVAQQGLAKAPAPLIRETEYRIAELGRRAQRAKAECAALNRSLRPAFEERLVDCRRRVADYEAEAAAKQEALAALIRHKDEPRQAQQQDAEQRFASILGTLRQQTALAARLHAKLSADNFGRGAALYRHDGGGLQATAPPPQSRRPLFIYLLLLFATATVVLIGGSAWRSWGKPPG